MSFHLVSSHSSASSNESLRPIPWKDLHTQAVDITMFFPNTGETRIIRVVYDPANTPFFEVRICTTCGARSSEEDPSKTLTHRYCRLEEVVVTIGDNIGVQSPSCFQGPSATKLNNIFEVLQLKYVQSLILFPEKRLNS